MRRGASKVDVRPLYVELQTLKPQLTQIQIAIEVGVSLATISRISRGIPVSPTNASFFSAYVAKYRSSPWACSHDMSQLRAKYIWFDSQSDHVFREFLDVFENMMQFHCAIFDEECIDSVFALWLLAWVAHDRAFRLMQDARNNANLAIARYDQALARLINIVSKSPSSKSQYGYLLDSLRIARFASFFNGQPRNTRARDPRVIDSIKSGHVIESVKAAGERSMHDWNLHRNGLIAASVINDKNAVRFFYERLVASDQRFKDLCFKPNNGAVFSLMDDPDLDFFREVFDSGFVETIELHDEHLDVRRSDDHGLVRANA